MYKYLTAVIVLLISVSLGAQELNLDDLNYFVGEWEGHETGKAGIGKGSRTYEFIMDGIYLFADNTSEFEPQEKNPEGEVHKDVSYVSYDKFRKTMVLREFHSESFVIQYTLDSLQSSGNKFVFVSESVENAPPGLRARVTLEIINENEFEETFELTFPGKDFTEYLKNYWSRAEELIEN